MNLINRITLPSEIRQLTNLQKLNLSDNQITTILSEIAQSNNLQALDLFNNQNNYNSI